MTVDEFLDQIGALAATDRYEEALCLAEKHANALLDQASAEEFSEICSVMHLIQRAADYGSPVVENAPTDAALPRGGDGVPLPGSAALPREE